MQCAIYDPDVSYVFEPKLVQSGCTVHLYKLGLNQKHVIVMAIKILYKRVMVDG